MASLNEEEKKWLGVGIAFSFLFIVFLVVYFFAFYSPNVDRMETRANNLRDDIEELEEEERKLTEFLEITSDKKIEELEETVREFRDFLPADVEVASLLEMMDDMLEETNLYHTSIRPLSTIEHSMYNEIPFRIEIEGGYWELIKFIDLIENAPRLMSIKNLDIESKMTYTTRLTLEERIFDMFREQPHAPEEELDALTLIQDRIKRGQPISRDERIKSLLGIPLQHDIILEISTYTLREREDA